jgi:tetratricopeptide (TPR) repeat protein
MKVDADAKAINKPARVNLRWLVIGLLVLLVLGACAFVVLRYYPQWSEKRLVARGRELLNQKKYAEAEILLLRALQIRERTIGPEHADVADALDNLSAIYYAQKKYSEAAPLLQRSLAIREKTLGPEHLKVAISLENYANVLQRLKREGEAAKLRARARTIWASATRKK